MEKVCFLLKRNFLIILGLLLFSGITTNLIGQINPAYNASNSAKSPDNRTDDSKYLWANEPFGAYSQSAEIVEKRTLNTKHFRNEYGTYTAHISSGGIHYMEDGRWKTIFHTILPSSNGFSNITNSHKTYYPTSSTGVITTVLPTGNRLVDMKDMRMYYEVNGQPVQPQNILNKQGMVNFNKLTYSNVYGTGIDLRLTQNTTQRKMDYIIQNQSALASIPAGAQFLIFEEKAELPSGWTAQLIDNEILLKDANGNIQAKYEKPVFSDTPPPHDHTHGEHDDHEHDFAEIEFVGSYDIVQNGTNVVIKTKVPLTWLMSSKRNFPVIIDPSINLYPSNANLWTGRVQHNTYGGADVATNTDQILLGRDGSGTNPKYSGWAKFDVTSLPDNSCINSASLWYNVLNHSSGDPTCEINVNMRHMANDPVSATNANRLADIRDGDIYGTANFAFSVLGPGWGYRTLNSSLNYLTAATISNWFAVGLDHYITGPHSSCWTRINGYSTVERPHLIVDYAADASNPPTSITGGGNLCWGNNITLTSTGGTNATGVSHVWYKGGCNNVFTQTWNGQPYGLVATTVNSNNNGVLNVTSTNGDPMINMFGLGSFAPATYRYINIRYRVASGTAGNVEIFFLNTTYPAPNGACHTAAPLISDNQWHIATVDLYQNANYTTGGNITGWRYDWCTANGVTMDLDFIQLSQYPMIDENNTTAVLEWTPAHPDYPTSGTTTYAASKIDPCGVVTSCASTTVTLPPRTNVLATNGEAATCTVNAGETVHFYNTTSGRYISTVSANATGLGSTTATTYIDVVSPAPNAAPILTNDCTDPSFQTIVLGRHWVITPTTNTSATVRLPYYNPELTAMYAPSTTSSSPYDDISSQAQLGLSKYSGPANINNQWTDNCPGTTTWQAPNAYGNVSAYVSGWPANTDRYSMFNITGFSEFWLHASNTIITPLAVSLSDFSASCENNQIKWITTSEHNSSHFTIEQSRNGYEWSEVKTVTGAGTTNSVTIYTIDNELSANYYRLKQVDFDGEAEYFGPISVDCGSNDNNSLSVYPNPNNGTFTVAVNTSESIGDATIFISDLSGKIIATHDIHILSGINTVKFERNNIVAGTYIVSITGKNKNTLTPVRLIVQ